MDPKATLERVAQAIEDGYFDDADEAIEDYVLWRRKGGFQPPGGDEKLKRLRKDLRLARQGFFEDNPRGDGREHEPDLGELTEALELYNDNTDSATVPRGGEKIYVFVWPPEGGRDGEWQLLAGVNAKKHQAEFGGKYVEVRIPGHEGGFNAFRAAVDALRALGIKVSNPNYGSSGACSSCGSTPCECDDDLDLVVEKGARVGHSGRPGISRYAWSGWIIGRDGTRIPVGSEDAEERTEAERLLLRRAREMHSRAGGNGRIRVRRGNPEGPPPGVPTLPKTPPTKNPNPEYNWFVSTARGTIFSGWEFKSDAQDDLRDNETFYIHTKPFLGPVKVVARRTLERLGVDPEDESNWYRNPPGAHEPTLRVKNPSHADLERAARSGKMTPDVAAWIKQYPKTWDNLKKRHR